MRLWCSLRTRDRPPLQIFTSRAGFQYEGLQAPKNATSYKSHDAPHTHLSWDSPVAFKLHNTSLRHKLYRMYVSNFFLTSHRGRRVNWSSFTTSIVSLLKVQYMFWGDGIIRKEKKNIRYDWISRINELSSNAPNPPFEDGLFIMKTYQINISVFVFSPYQYHKYKLNFFSQSAPLSH